MKCLGQIIYTLIWTMCYTLPCARRDVYWQAITKRGTRFSSAICFKKSMRFLQSTSQNPAWCCPLTDPALLRNSPNKSVWELSFKAWSNQSNERCTWRMHNKLVYECAFEWSAITASKEGECSKKVQVFNEKKIYNFIKPYAWNAIHAWGWGSPKKVCNAKMYCTGSAPKDR